MHKSPYISRNEVLQIVVRHNDGDRIEESDLLAKTYPTLADVVLTLDDEVQRVIRFDLDTLTGEDLTEEIARAYLDGHQTCSWEEDTLPDYVRQSQAWIDHCDDEDTSFDPRAEHGTYRTIGGRVA